MTVSDRLSAITDIRRGVDTALTLERIPGFNDSGFFLGVCFSELTPPRLTIEIDEGTRCHDEYGLTNIGVGGTKGLNTGVAVSARCSRWQVYQNRNHDEGMREARKAKKWIKWWSLAGLEPTTIGL
jgi:hypothetical protein